MLAILSPFKAQCSREASKKRYEKRYETKIDRYLPARLVCFTIDAPNTKSTIGGISIDLMNSAAFVAVVESDHKVKAPSSLAIGAKVLVMPMPSLTELLEDTARRARFAATRQAVREAMQAEDKGVNLTDEAIVSLVHRARQSSHAR